MNDANRGAVVVWKLDRFGRSLRHLVNALAGFEPFRFGTLILEAIPCPHPMSKTTLSPDRKTTCER
jgi:hypothetical protein